MPMIRLLDLRTTSSTCSTHGHIRHAILLMGVLMTCTSNFSAMGMVSPPLWLDMPGTKPAARISASSSVSSGLEVHSERQNMESVICPCTRQTWQFTRFR